MSSKKRVSVFARLGPAGPTSPDETVPPASHRRYSSEKHLEKPHHSHTLPPPPHSHTHSSSRDDTVRERKPSHHDYDDKKHLHYREVPLPPPSLPSTSSSLRHRSHKHYHDDPKHLDYADKPHREMSRGEKQRSSLSSPIPPPPPAQSPAARKSRDLVDRLSPTGKDILSKPFMAGGYEQKMGRSGSLGSGSASEGDRGQQGGGRAKRVSPTEPVGPSDGDTSEASEENRRKRSRSEKKPKPDGGVLDDPSKRPIKPHHTLERKEKVGERERHGWPEKLPTSSPSSSVHQVMESGELRETRGRGERGVPARQSDERDTRRKWDEEWSESRDLARKRKRDTNLEESCTPPPDVGQKRARTTEQGSKEQGLEGGSMSLSRDEKHPRQAKDGSDSLERKRKYESPSSTAANELDKEGPPPKKPRSGGESSSGASSSRKLSRADTTASSLPVGSTQRKKSEHHRGSRAEEYSSTAGASGNSETSDTAKAPPKLDWGTISSLSLPRPKPTSTSALQRFSPGAVFSRIGVSRSLAGQSLFELVSMAVSKHLAKEEETVRGETGNRFPESLLEQPFGDSEFAMTGVSRMRNAKENCHVCVNIGPNRQALIASFDFTLRRKLGKSAKGLIPPMPSAATWSSEQFTTAKDLYNSLGTKASGKPAFRLEHSLVGTLLIPK